MWYCGAKPVKNCKAPCAESSEDGGQGQFATAVIFAARTAVRQLITTLVHDHGQLLHAWFIMRGGPVSRTHWRDQSERVSRTVYAPIGRRLSVRPRVFKSEHEQNRRRNRQICSPTCGAAMPGMGPTRRCNAPAWTNFSHQEQRVPRVGALRRDGQCSRHRAWIASAAWYPTTGDEGDQSRA